MNRELARKKAEELVSKMTIEEKAALTTGSGLHGLSCAGLERFGIPEKNFADGPHGERNYNPGTDSTCLPSCYISSYNLLCKL